MKRSQTGNTVIKTQKRTFLVSVSLKFMMEHDNIGWYLLQHREFGLGQYAYTVDSVSPSAFSQRLSTPPCSQGERSQTPISAPASSLLCVCTALEQLGPRSRPHLVMLPRDCISVLALSCFFTCCHQAISADLCPGQLKDFKMFLYSLWWSQLKISRGP